MGRILFKLENTRVNYFCSLKNISGLSWNLLAKKLEISERQLRDIRKGIYSFPTSIANVVQELYGIQLPNAITVQKDYWHVKKAAKLGGKRRFELYGSPGTSEGRRKGGINSLKTHQKNNSGFKLSKSILTPNNNTKLAELVGALLGDGNLSLWQARIYLNIKTDADYALYLKRLFEKLFGIKVSTHERLYNSTIEVVASSNKLVAFLKTKGLPIGNKLRQGLDIPSWTRQRKEWQIACLRGLFDTDGCTYIDHHRYKDNVYGHICVVFTSYSMQLLNSVFNTLRKLEYSPTLNNKRNVLLRKEKEALRFFQEFKPSNQRHSNVLRIFKEEYRSGYNGTASKAVVAVR